MTGYVGVKVTVREPDRKHSKIAERQLAPLRRRIGVMGWCEPAQSKGALSRVIESIRRLRVAFWLERKSAREARDD